MTLRRSHRLRLVALTVLSGSLGLLATSCSSSGSNVSSTQHVATRAVEPDALAGFYNLTFAVSEGGGSYGGAAVIKVIG